MNDKLFLNYIELIHNLLKSSRHVAAEDKQNDGISDHLVIVASSIAHRIQADIEKLDILYKDHDDLEAIKLCMNELFVIYENEFGQCKG